MRERTGAGHADSSNPLSRAHRNQAYDSTSPSITPSFSVTTTSSLRASMYQQPQVSAGDAVAAADSGSQQAQQAAAYINQYCAATDTPVPVVAGPIVAPGALSYYAFSGNNIAQTDVKPGEVSPPPAEPAVTLKVAENAMRKLVTAELKRVGFENAEPMTAKQLELEVQACEFESLSH